MSRKRLALELRAISPEGNRSGPPGQQAGRRRALPFLSVIIPVYGVQGYLRECLDSVLDQRFDDFEVIAIDDNSPDHCGRILDEYAERDPRMRVVHLDHNIGNGHARNLGLARAAGEYVWFVDSDDRLATGAIPAVVEALRRSDPQVLLVDHVRVSALGEFAHQGARRAARRDHRHHRRRRTPAAEGVHRRLEQDPAAGLPPAHRSPVRHRLVAEDILFTYPVLIAAERVATLRRVCYHLPPPPYRRHHLHPQHPSLRGVRPVVAGLRSAGPDGPMAGRRSEDEAGE